MTSSQKEKIEISVKIMADVVESYLGALTLDQGLEAAERFLQVHLFPTLTVSAWLVTNTPKLFIVHLLSLAYWLRKSINNYAYASWKDF